MNVSVLEFLFMTDSIYLPLITTFLILTPSEKIKCQNHSQLYIFLGNYIYFLACSSLIALLYWLISIWFHIGLTVLLRFCSASRYAGVQLATVFKSNENTNLMQHCAGFISAGSLYMFRAQASIIRSI